MEKISQQRVDNFLEHVQQQILTENQADLITEELEDHIDCLVEDYLESGLEETEAVSKALLQMGDPQEIGYSFTDYDAMKKRKYAMFAFKMSGIVALVATFLIGLFSQPLSWDNEIVSLFPMLANLFNVWLVLTGSSMLIGKSMRFIELDTTPFIIIWPVKARFKWEYWSLALFCLPMVLIFVFLYFYESGVNSMSIMAMWPILTLSYSVWAMVHSEKYRVPKYLVVSEGFVIKGRFVSWTSIASYQWSKDFLAKNQEHYKLTLNSHIKTEQQRPLKKVIHIHKRQHNYLHALLKERI